MPDDQWDPEEEAAPVVAAQFGATWRKRDVPGAPDKTHDFDLAVGDRIVALEVTSATDESTRGLWDAVGKRDWDDESLSRSWILVLKPEARIGRLRTEVGPLLQTLDQAGVTKFPDTKTMATRSPQETHALERLKLLGVEAGSAFDGHPTGVVISVSGTAEATAAENLNLAVEPEIEANIDKLRRAVADERHLFIWLDWSSQNAQMALHHMLTFGRLPASPPVLPEGLDSVWAMPATMANDQPRPLLAATRSGWRCA
jgi:hypothetical protein